MNADPLVQFRLALTWTAPLTADSLASCSLTLVSSGAGSIGLRYQRGSYRMWFVRIDYRPSGFTDASVLARAVAGVVARAEVARPGCTTCSAVTALQRRFS